MIAHIGYHKTGTTFLQNNIYPYLKGCEYFDYPKCDAIFTDLINKDDATYDKENTNRLIQGFRSTEDVPLFSYEGLVGPLFFCQGYDATRIAKRLKEVGVSKVVVSIRNQVRLFESIYLQYIQEGGVIRPDEFFDRKDVFDWNYADFFHLISFYRQLFGAENVLVILQEELLKDQDKVVKELLAFIGAEVSVDKNRKKKNANKSLSPISINILRFCNRFTYNKFKPSQMLSKRITTWKIRHLLQAYLDPMFLSSVSKKKRFMPSDVNVKVTEHFRQGNIQLQGLLGEKMTKYDYFKS